MIELVAEELVSAPKMALFRGVRSLVNLTTPNQRYATQRTVSNGSSEANVFVSWQ